MIGRYGDGDGDRCTSLISLNYRSISVWSAQLMSSRCCIAIAIAAISTFATVGRPLCVKASTESLHVVVVGWTSHANSPTTCTIHRIHHTAMAGNFVGECNNENENWYDFDHFETDKAWKLIWIVAVRASFIYFVTNQPMTEQMITCDCRWSKVFICVEDTRDTRKYSSSYRKIYILT